MLNTTLVEDFFSILTSLDNEEVAQECPINVPWEVLVDTYQWAARNENGNVWAFENKPFFMNGEWFPQGGAFTSLHDLKFNRGNIPAKLSLQERPLPF